MLNVMRQIIIYPGEDGYWVAQCPSLPHCISQGKTKQEAISYALNHEMTRRSLICRVG